MVSLLLFLLLAAPILAFGLVGYAFGRAGAWRGRADRLRSTAAVLAAAATCVYGLGLLGLAGAVLDAGDGGAYSAPVRPCRVAGQPERDGHVTGWRVEYVPLRFVCETSDDRYDDYASPAVPGWITPAAAGLALASAAAAGGAAAAGARTVRRGPAA